MTQKGPSWDFENACSSDRVAGVDEVGRGAWAGPVVCAAVILNKKAPLFRKGLFDLRDLTDSKMLTAQKRRWLVRQIKGYLACYPDDASWGLGWISAGEIDCWGLQTGVFRAMARALHSLSIRPKTILIDGMSLPKIKKEGDPEDADGSWPKAEMKTVIQGDRRSFSIAASSVLAKVVRDQVMEDLDLLYPQFDFANNKGYGTRTHQDGLSRAGVCPIHRKSFKPIRLRLQD